MTGIVYESARPVPPGANSHGEAQGLARLHGQHVQLMMVDVPLRAPGLDGPAPGAGYTMVVSLMTPRSRGRLRLAGAAAQDAPLVAPRYYTAPQDLEAAADGLRLARNLGESAALADWRGKEVQPGPGVTDGLGLRAYARRNLRTYDHLVGTCRMGHDENAVVDEMLRVRGVEDLRVVDASVMRQRR
ncbi:GMC oxidoreductase [Micromonospora sp. NPDC049230]|uniref:GMC oxidoreductase n=1 Tax=Micromonospora sp. NPDC049230 TaxID=3155502 RepID=UPI0034002390